MMRVSGSRLALAVRIERFALALRYTAYAVLVSIFLLGYLRGSYSDLAIITGVVAVHHLFVHAVLWTKRYDLFVTPVNFLIHLSEISIIVSFTGAEESDLFVLYLFLLVGYTVYRRRFYRVLAVSGLCCFAYGVVIAVEWRLTGISVPPGIIFSKMLSILACGWLVASISELLRESEESDEARAAAQASSEATLRTILDSTADPILVYDESECITEVNDKACQFLGLSRERILGNRFRSFVFDDGTLQDKLAEAYAHNEYHGEQLFIDTEDRERTVEIHIRAYIRSAQRYFVVVAHDITERKSLQEATQLANANLARLNRELQQVNELKTGLITTISQRIRSPLTALLGYTDMLLNDEFGPLADDQRQALQKCRRTTLRVVKLVDEAFDIRPADTVHPTHG